MEREYEAQIANATCEGVKIALNNHLASIEKYKNIENSFTTETTYHMDKMLVHARIVRVEEHLGNINTKNEHINSAQQECKMLLWDDCSEQKILWFSKESEKNHPISCLND